jgi:hypothetical protein
MDEKEKAEYRKAFMAAINRGNPNKLAEIILRVNQLVEERKKKLWQRLRLNRSFRRT